MVGGVDQLIGKGDLHFVRITCSSSSCDVYLWGATLTSWVHHGSEQLYLSDIAVFDGVKAIRGGIPLVFPQFGQPNPSMSQHGFARTKVWTFLGHHADQQTTTAIFSLQHDDQTLSLWPHPFQLLYEVRLATDGLTTKLHIFNTGDQPCSFQALLHTYLRVSDVASVSVRGLLGLSFLDKLDTAGSPVESREVVRIDGEVDRVYASSTEPVILQDSVCLRSVSKNAVVTAGASLEGMVASAKETRDVAALLRHLHGDQSGETQQPVDVVLWNAWEARSRALPDLDDDAYQRYVCVEPGVVAQPSRLLPGQRLVLSQDIRFL
eukprot:gene35633-43218_t